MRKMQFCQLKKYINEYIKNLTKTTKSMKFNENLMRRAFSSNSYLFPEILIRDNPDEVTQILTGFEAVFIKNCFKAGKDLGHFIRVFS